LLVVPDHYIFRMLFSQGVRLEDLGVTLDGSPVETDGRTIWRRFSEHYYLFRGTPTRAWLDYVPESVRSFQAAHGEHVRPLLRRDSGTRHATIFVRAHCMNASTSRSSRRRIARSTILSGISRSVIAAGRAVVPAYRPDSVDPDFEVSRTTSTGSARLPAAIRVAGAVISKLIFRAATISRVLARRRPTGLSTADTANLNVDEARAVRQGPVWQGRFCRASVVPRADADRLAKMSVDDGLVMQIHPSSWRNHSPAIFRKFGRDKGFDIPTRTDYVRALKPLLDAVGTDPRASIILFTLDETSYARTRAAGQRLPGAQARSCLVVPRQPGRHAPLPKMTTETAGFYNTVASTTTRGLSLDPGSP
jgi:glucuronate isomerase